MSPHRTGAVAAFLNEPRLPHMTLPDPPRHSDRMRTLNLDVRVEHDRVPEMVVMH